MSKGNIFIISGPSGSGKDSILSEVFNKRPDIFFSISSITRDMRIGEVEGEKYHFISKEEFEKGLSNDDFLEHNSYVGNYYGTPKTPVIDAINNNRDAIIEVDVNGATQIRNKLKDSVSIFIIPPSFEVLNKRLHRRGTETEEQINKRITAAFEEIKRADEYDYIIVNDNLEDAVNDFLTIIDSRKLTFENQKNILNEVMKNA